MEKVIETLMYDGYELTKTKIREDELVLFLSSRSSELTCPHCNQASSKVHSYYTREIQDLPVLDRKTMLIVATRKMYCMNPDCGHTTFSEQHGFAGKNSKKTRRLTDKILMISSEMSSVGASKVLSSGNITVGKSTICNLLKKNPTHRRQIQDSEDLY